MAFLPIPTGAPPTTSFRISASSQSFSDLRYPQNSDRLRAAGEVAEWSKAHAWKVCVRKRTEGSTKCDSGAFWARERSDGDPQDQKRQRQWRFCPSRPRHHPPRPLKYQRDLSLFLTYDIHKTLVDCAPLVRWPSGRRRTPGKCVYGNVPRVRIPPSPP